MRKLVLFLIIVLLLGGCQFRTVSNLAGIYEVNKVKRFQDRVSLMKQEYKKALEKELRYVKYQSNKDTLMFHSFVQFINSTKEVIFPKDYHTKLGNDYTKEVLLDKLHFSLPATTIVVINKEESAYVSTTLTLKKEENNIYKFSPVYQKILSRYKENEYDIVFNIINSSCVFGYKKDGTLDIYMYSKITESHEPIDFETFKQRMKE